MKRTLKKTQKDDEEGEEEHEQEEEEEHEEEVEEEEEEDEEYKEEEKKKKTQEEEDDLQKTFDRKAKQRKKRKRMSYTPEENQAMIDWLDEHGTQRGNLFLMMERENVTAHSWRSMRNHFQNVIVPMLRRAKHPLTLRPVQMDTPAKARKPEATAPDADGGGGETEETAAAAAPGGGERGEEEAEFKNYADLIVRLESVAAGPTGKRHPPQSAAAAIPTPAAIAKSPAASVVRPPVRIEREAFIRQRVADLMAEHKVPLNVVLHAIAVHDGDSERAGRYLAGETDTRPWTVEEDMKLIQQEGAAPVIETRGEQAVASRMRFLSCAP